MVTSDQLWHDLGYTMKAGSSATVALLQEDKIIQEAIG